MTDAEAGMLLPYPRPDSPVATRPAMDRQQFEAITSHIFQVLRARPVSRVALWFDDSALFSCALLACWAAGAQVLVAPDLLNDTCTWIHTEADLWVTDQAVPNAHIPVFRLDPFPEPDTESAATGTQSTPPASEKPAGLSHPAAIRTSFSIPASPSIPTSSAIAVPASTSTPTPISLPASQTPSIFQQRENGLFLPLPADAHLFLRTSGSSGTPGVIRKTFTQLQAEAVTLVQTWSLQGLPATLIGSVSHQHMYGLTFRVMVPLHAGLILDRQQARYPETLVEQTLTHDRCVWITSPALLQRLPDSIPWEALHPRLSRVVSAGGALSDATRASLLQRQWPLHEIYGSTETGVIATRHQQSVWTPLPDVVIATDSQDRLAVSSPWTEGIEQTADVITVAEDKGFILQGRADRILKLEDKRISLSRVEQAAMSHQYVSDIHCAPSPLGGRLCALVELTEAGVSAMRQHGRRHITRTLSDHLRTAVDPLAVPRHWRFPDVLPRNAQSKITLQQVRECFFSPRRGPQWEVTAGAPTDSAAAKAPKATNTTNAAKAASAANTSATANSNEVSLAGRVPVDLVYFSGHFPSFPLVPGVAQLGWALEQAKARNMGSGEIHRIENLKFQHFLRPADPCTMTLKWDHDKHKLYFSVRTGTNMTASGRIAFTAAA